MTNSATWPNASNSSQVNEQRDLAFVAADEVYAGLTLQTWTNRCYVALGMVASVDGASQLEGRSGGLGGSGDLAAFRRLRDASDVILVGGRTVTAERYRPPVPASDRQAGRVSRGLAPVPRLAIVTRSGQLPTELPAFGDPTHRPLVYTASTADEHRIAALRSVADVVCIDETSDRDPIELILDDLWARQLSRVVCEGGPTINTMLFEHDLIDEVFLTVAPILAGNDAKRIIAATASDATPVALECVSAQLAEGDLLLRYRRRRSVDAAQLGQ